MKLRFVEVEINNEHFQTKTRKIIAGWEVPVAFAVHPASEEIRDVVVDLPAPSVSDEYNRLRDAYGNGRQEDGSISQPNVEEVYGKGIMGTQQLKIAMQACVLPKATPVTPLAPPPTIRKDLLHAVAGDDVLIEEPTEETGADEDRLADVAA